MQHHGEETYHEVASPNRPPQLKLANLCTCRCRCGCLCGLSRSREGENGNHDLNGGTAPPREEGEARSFVHLVPDPDYEPTDSELIPTKCGLISLHDNEFVHVECHPLEQQGSRSVSVSVSSMSNEAPTSGHRSMASSTILNLPGYDPLLLADLIDPREPLPGLFCQPPLRLTPDMPRLVVVFNPSTGPVWMAYDQPLYAETIASEDLTSCD